MARWRRRLGRLVLVLVLFGSGFLGSRLDRLLSTPVAQASHNFADVPTGAFYHAFVEYLAQSGVTAGCALGQYCPEQAVTRGQMAVFLGLLRLVAGCPPDAVRVGATCIDKYEASVWQTTNAALIQKIRLGTAAKADLLAAGAVQRGLIDDYAGAGCQRTGAGCTTLYAVSIPGVTPSRFATWFQAVAFARNSGKRLPTNGEWQAAALGTPDPPAGPCVVNAGGPGETGTPGCVSDTGAFDLVGNVGEWVDVWFPAGAGGALNWSPFSDDFLNLVEGVAALDRGAHHFFGLDPFPPVSAVGPLAVHGFDSPLASADALGFRGAR